MNLPSSVPLSTNPFSNLINIQRPSQKNDAKLHLLRQHDTQRIWEAIDDQRVCLLCGSEFTGDQIRIRVENARPVFRCPDAQCKGVLTHFVYAGNPLLSEESWTDWMRVKGNDGAKSPLTQK